MRKGVPKVNTIVSNINKVSLDTSMASLSAWRQGGRPAVSLASMLGKRPLEAGAPPHAASGPSSRASPRRPGPPGREALDSSDSSGCGELELEEEEGGGRQIDLTSE